MTYCPPKELKVLKRIRVPVFSKRPPALDVHKITPADVRDFWAAMTAHYNVRVVDKNSSAEMQMVADHLDRLGIVDHDAFLHDFVTTLDESIYTPFEIGVPTGRWDLWQQMIVLPHEIRHIEQNRAKEGLLYEFEYASNSTKRAFYEMEGYRCQMSLAWIFRGEELSPAGLASVLKVAYNCNDADVAMVTKMLQLSMISIKKGAIPSPSCQFAYHWMHARFEMG